MRKHFSVFAVLTLMSINVIPALAQSPARTTTSDPAGVERRVDTLLSQMTLEEKIDLLGGVDGFYIRGIPRIGWPRLKMADGPIGVRNYGPATAMAAGINLAATWNAALAERVGYIKGVQAQGVSATVKHFMGNNSEFDRHNTDAIIDERTMREIYLPVFEAAVKEANVGAIMDSYNLTNGAHLTQNGYLNTDVVKNEWGFRGIIMSDWTSTYDGIAAANGGLDLEMPSAIFMNRQTLLPAIQQGKVTVATIDEKVRRILRTAIRFGWLDRDQTDLSIPRFNQRGRSVALAAARESQVLLKNQGRLLPLNKGKIRSIAVIGPNAHPAVPVGGGSARVEPFVATSILEGISNYLGSTVPVYYARGLPSLAEMADATSFSTEPVNGQPGLRSEYFDSNDLQGKPSITRTEQHINFRAGTRAELPAGSLSARWTGYYVVQEPGNYDFFVASSGEDGGYYRLYLGDKLVFDSWSKIG